MQLQCQCFISNLTPILCSSSQPKFSLERLCKSNAISFPTKNTTPELKYVNMPQNTYLSYISQEVNLNNLNSAYLKDVIF